MHLLVAPGVALAMGIVFVALGVSVIAFRRPIHGWIVNEQRRAFGPLGRALSKRSTPMSLVPAAVLAVGLGAVLAIAAVISITS